MSENQQKDVHVRVINEEYTRVLNNPENIIVSEDLQELLDIPLSESAEDSSTSTFDTMTISVLDKDGLPISVRGDFMGLSSSEKSYSVTVASSNIKKQFLESLDSLRNTPGMLTISGVYELEVQDCEVSNWMITQVGAADFSLIVHFRSKNGIF
tara:strand:+ start:109 stop:570 length:462 start_codon:yes stop_codon:yes gene_type:complete